MTYSLQYLGLDPSKPQTTQETFPWWQFPFVNNEKTDWPGRFNQIRKCTFLKKWWVWAIYRTINSFSVTFLQNHIRDCARCSGLQLFINPNQYWNLFCCHSCCFHKHFRQTPCADARFSPRFLFSFFSLSIFQPVRSHASLSLDSAFMGFSCINVWIWNACGVRLDKVSYKR